MGCWWHGARRRCLLALDGRWVAMALATCWGAAPLPRASTTAADPRTLTHHTADRGGCGPRQAGRWRCQGGVRRLHPAVAGVACGRAACLQRPARRYHPAHPKPPPPSPTHIHAAPMPLAAGWQQHTAALSPLPLLPGVVVCTPPPPLPPAVRPGRPNAPAPPPPPHASHSGPENTPLPNMCRSAPTRPSPRCWRCPTPSSNPWRCST